MVPDKLAIAGLLIALGVVVRSKGKQAVYEPEPCDWDVLSDDVVAYEIIPKVLAISNRTDSVPFYPRLVLQCARKGVFVWPMERLAKILSLRPSGPFIKELQDALLFKFEGSPAGFEFDSRATASHSLFRCKNIKKLIGWFPGRRALQGLPKLSASLQHLTLAASASGFSSKTATELTDNLAPLTRLTSLKLAIMTDNKEGRHGFDFGFLNGLRSLRSLALDLSSGGHGVLLHFAAVRSLTALESVSLENLTVTPEMLDAFDRAPRLADLRFVSCNLQNAPLSRLSTLTHLARLEAVNSGRVDSPPNNVLTSLTCVVLTGAALPSWAQDCSALQELDAWETTQNDLALLEPLTRLASLSLNGTGCTSLAPLSSLVGLRDLRLFRFSALTDFSALSHLTALTRFQFWCSGESGATIPFYGFSHLTSKQLRHLGATGIRCFGEGEFEHLARLTTLTHLSLARSAVDDAALSHLRALSSNLRSLDLRETKITNQGVCDTIAHLSRLTSLNVACKRVTLLGLRSLKTIPCLEIKGDYTFLYAM